MTGALLSGAAQVARAQGQAVSLEGSEDRRSDIYRPRITSFVVGSTNYSNRNQLVPEFAGSVPAPNLPGRVNFRFDKLAVGVVQRFTPWITATGVLTVESEAHMHSHGYNPTFGCPGVGTQPCAERFGSETPANAVELDVLDVTAAIPIGNRPTIAIGRFHVPFGFERDDEPLLFTATTSEVFRYGRPQHMTGLMGGYSFAPWLNLAAWVVNRWESHTNDDDFNDNNKFHSLGGRLGLTLSPTEHLFTVGIGGFWGHESSFNNTTMSDGGNKARQVIAVDLSWTPVRRLFLTGEFVSGKDDSVTIRQRGAPIDGPSGVRNVEWKGAYLLGHYDIVDWCGLSVRFGVFDDPSGGRTGVNQTLSSVTLTPVFHLSRLNRDLGATGAVYERSRHPIERVDLRVEYRYNFSNRTAFAYAPNAALDFQTQDVSKSGSQVIVMLVVNSLFR
jgi:hypothetical protein